MSEKADDIAKLLDNGYEVVLFRNGLGSYTATARQQGVLTGIVETDDLTPAKALYRLSEKVTTGRIVP